MGGDVAVEGIRLPSLHRLLVCGLCGPVKRMLQHHMKFKQEVALPGALAQSSAA
jgi:hypothetical protein